jgi:hypothetical protein
MLVYVLNIDCSFQKVLPMKIKGKKFTWDSRGDGEYTYDIDVSAENDSDSTIELARTSCVLLAKDGATLGGSAHDEEDLYLEPGESGSFEVRTWGDVYRSQLEGEPESAKAQVDVTFFRREFLILGDFNVPSKNSDAELTHDYKDVSGGDLKVLGASIRRDPEDRDGDSSVEAIVGLRNVGEGVVQKAIVKMILIDRDGAQIDFRERDESIPPRSAVVFDPSIYAKSGRLKGATVKITVTVFEPIAHESVLLDTPTKQDGW